MSIILNRSRSRNVRCPHFRISPVFGISGFGLGVPFYSVCLRRSAEKNQPMIIGKQDFSIHQRDSPCICRWGWTLPWTDVSLLAVTVCRQGLRLAREQGRTFRSKESEIKNPFRLMSAWRPRTYRLVNAFFLRRRRRRVEKNGTNDPREASDGKGAF